MKTAFSDELDGLIAEITPEQMDKVCLALPSLVDKNPRPQGFLHSDLRKLWTAISNLADGVNEKVRQMQSMEPSGVKPTKEESVALQVLRARYDAAVQYFWHSVRAQYGWSKSLGIGEGWQVAEVDVPCSHGGLDLEGLGLGSVLGRGRGVVITLDGRSSLSDLLAGLK